MGNFTLSEILTIVLVILIIFGPNRLPEMARKAGEWTAKARQAASSFRAEIRNEYGDTLEPIRQVRDDLRGIGSEMREGVAKMDRGVRDTLGSVKDDFESELTVSPPNPAGTAPSLPDDQVRPADPVEQAGRGAADGPGEEGSPPPADQEQTRPPDTPA